MTEPAEEQQQPSLVQRPTGPGVDLRGTVLDGLPFDLSGPDDGWECPVLFKREEPAPKQEQDK